MRGKKITAEILLKISIFPYSDIKSRAKTPLPNSTLYPETNSDSPSAKSKGARFVSANTIKTKTIQSKGEMKI